MGRKCRAVVLTMMVAFTGQQKYHCHLVSWSTSMTFVRQIPKWTTQHGDTTPAVQKLYATDVCNHPIWRGGWWTMMGDVECIQSTFSSMSAYTEDKTPSRNKFCSIMRLGVTGGMKWTNKMSEFGTVNHQVSTNVTLQRLLQFVM